MNMQGQSLHKTTHMITNNFMPNTALLNTDTEEQVLNGTETSNNLICKASRTYYWVISKWDVIYIHASHARSTQKWMSKVVWVMVVVVQCSSCMIKKQDKNIAITFVFLISFIINQIIKDLNILLTHSKNIEAGLVYKQKKKKMDSDCLSYSFKPNNDLYF